MFIFDFQLSFACRAHTHTHMHWVNLHFVHLLGNSGAFFPRSCRRLRQFYLRNFLSSNCVSLFFSLFACGNDESLASRVFLCTGERHSPSPAIHFICTFFSVVFSAIRSPPSLHSRQTYYFASVKIVRYYIHHYYVSRCDLMHFALNSITVHRSPNSIEHSQAMLIHFKMAADDGFLFLECL